MDRFLFYGGGSWIRTSEVSDNRFTVCPLWPLGNSPKLMELVIGVEPTTCWLQISCSAVEPRQHIQDSFFWSDNLKDCSKIWVAVWVFIYLILYYTKIFLKSQREEKIPYQSQVKPTLYALKHPWPRRTLPTSLSLTCNSIANQDVAWASYHRLSYCLIRNFPLKINLFAFHRLTAALGAARYFNQ